MALEGDLARGFAVAGWGLRVAGTAMAVLGSIHLGDALTPQPVPKPGAGLVGHGLYRFVRHPIYAGLLAYGIGSVLVNPYPATLAAGAGLLMLLMVKAVALGEFGCDDAYRSIPSGVCVDK